MKAMSSKRVAELIERAGRLTRTDAHAEGLLPVQWEALRYLEKANRFSSTAAALTAYLGLTKGTVSQTVKALEAKGLVLKRVDPKDRRSKRLSLSAKGRRLLARDPLKETISTLEELPTRDRNALGSGLESLLSKRLESRGRQPFGQCSECQYFAARHPQGDPHFCQLLQERLNPADSQAICFEQSPAA